MATCRLMLNLSNPNAVDKDLQTIATVDCRYKEPCDMLNPIVILSPSSSFLKANYLYLSDFERYYFVDEITTEHQRLMLRCRVDVLQSNVTKIKALKGFCLRNEKKLLESNGIFYDNEYPVRSDRVVREFKIGSLGIASEIYLTVVGGAS